MNLICFFFNDTATTEIYTLSLHDALPIFDRPGRLIAHPDISLVLRGTDDPAVKPFQVLRASILAAGGGAATDRKSTRLNSSHANISYAVFCLKKKRSNCSLATSSYIETSH